MHGRKRNISPSRSGRKKKNEGTRVNRLRRIAADSGSSPPFRSAKRDDNEEMSILWLKKSRTMR